MIFHGNKNQKTHKIGNIVHHFLRRKIEDPPADKETMILMSKNLCRSKRKAVNAKIFVLKKSPKKHQIAIFRKKIM